MSGQSQPTDKGNSFWHSAHGGLLILTITFMLSVTRMLSVKRGGVIILTAKNRELPPLLLRLRLSQ